MKKADWSEPVTLTCPVCGSSFTRYASQVRWRGGKYCSYVCQNKAKKPRSRICKECSQSFIPSANLNTRPDRGKYCSRQCYYTAIGKNSRIISLLCKGCGREFTRYPSSVTKDRKPSFCSRKCADSAKHRVGSTHHRGSNWTKIKERIRERDEHVCVRCNSTEPNGKLLAVDHVIPWVLMKDDEARANHGDNLASLCSACHAIKTHRIEPRLMKGDLISLIEFYGEERSRRANENWNNLGLALSAGESEEL